MALAMTDAIPLMESDGTTGRNNARDFRTQLWPALTLPDSGGTSVRPGVIPRKYTGVDYVDLKAIQLASPGSAVQLYPGRCFITRTGQGAYLASQETTVTSYPFSNADPTNPRYDLLYARQYDAAIGDVGTHGPYLEHITGTAAGSPVVPTLPTDAIPIAAILRPANTNPITNANITDLRKSAGLLGTLRPLLPGDALADAGLFVGERRSRITPSGLTALGAPPILEEVWGADGAWHGTQDFTIGPLTQTGSGTLTVGGNGLVVIAVTIPDPGYAYKIVAGGSIGWTVVAATSPGNLFEGAVTIDSTVYTTNRIVAGYTVSASIGANFTQSTLHVHEKRDPTTYTGSHIVRLMARNTGATNFTVPAAAPDTAMTVRIVPA